MAIHRENWQQLHYQVGPYRAFIGLGYSPKHEDFSYQVVVTENEQYERFSSNFNDLDDACHFLNQYYSHWQLASHQEESDGSSCGSCAAH